MSNPVSPRRGITVPTWAFISILLLLILFGMVIIGLGGKTVSASSAATRTATIPGPVKTVTVEKPVATGVSASDFQACATAYAQVVDLLGQQTTILRNFSYAASDGFTAVSDGDTAALEASTEKINGYTSDEQALGPKIDEIDAAACSN